MIYILCMGANIIIFGEAVASLSVPVDRRALSVVRWPMTVVSMVDS